MIRCNHGQNNWQKVKRDQAKLYKTRYLWCLIWVLFECYWQSFISERKRLHTRLCLLPSLRFSLFPRILSIKSFGRSSGNSHAYKVSKTRCIFPFHLWRIKTGVKHSQLPNNMTRFVDQIWFDSTLEFEDNSVASSSALTLYRLHNRYNENVINFYLNFISTNALDILCIFETKGDEMPSFLHIALEDLEKPYQLFLPMESFDLLIYA